MVTKGHRILEDVDEIVGTFAPVSDADSSLGFFAVKQLFPISDVQCVEIRIRSDEKSARAIKRTLDDFDALESIISTTKDKLQSKNTFSIHPSEVGKEEFILFLRLFSELYSFIENVRFLIFHSVNDEKFVSDIAVCDRQFMLSRKRFSVNANADYYEHCLYENPDDVQLKRLWYEETLEYSVFSDDIDERVRHIEMLRKIIPGPKSEADTCYCYALRDFKVNNDASAMKNLFDAIEIYPEHFDSVYTLANQFFNKKDFVNALRFYSRAIDLCNDCELREKRIDCLLALGRWNELPGAILDLIHCTSVSGLRRLVVFCNKFKNLVDTEMTCLALEELVKHFASYHSNNNVDGEEELELTKALSLAYLYLAYAEFSRRNNEIALRYLNRITDDLQWDNIPAHRARATFFLEEKRIDDLRESVEMLKTLDGQNPDTFILEGGFYILTKAYEQALVCYRRAVSIDPSNCHNGYLGIGHALAWLRRDDEAIPFFEKSLVIKPKQPRCLSDLASCLSNVGQIDEAIALLNEAIELDPTYYHPYYIKGCISALKGEVDDALMWLQRSVKCNKSVIDYLKHEQDLKNLRDLPAFIELLKMQ